MKKTSFLLFALTILAARAHADTEFLMPADLAYGYGNTTSESMQLQLRLMPELNIDLSDSTRLVSSFRVRIDPTDRLEPGEAPRDAYAPLSRPLALGDTGLAEIRDLYIETDVGKSLLRLGKQQIVWGRLDGIKVLDVLNPQDFREFILEDFGESRIGLWSAYLDAPIGAWRAELAVIPDGTGHVIPNQGAWFELRAPRFRFGAGPEQPGLPLTTESRAHDFDSTAAGLRLSRSIGRVDLSLVGYSGIDPEPLGRIGSDGTGAVVERYFERRQLAGFSAETGIGNAVVRVEYAFQPDRAFNLRTPSSLTAVELDQHRAAIGLDFSLPGSVFVNAQFLLDTVRDAPTTLVRPDTDRLSTLYLRKSFGYDKVSLEARWYHSFTDKDDMFSAAISVLVGENSRVRLQADGFTGTTAGLFGQFESSDRVVLAIEHVF